MSYDLLWQWAHQMLFRNTFSFWWSFSINGWNFFFNLNDSKTETWTRMDYHFQWPKQHLNIQNWFKRNTVLTKFGPQSLEIRLKQFILYKLKSQLKIKHFFSHITSKNINNFTNNHKISRSSQNLKITNDKLVS